MLLLLAMCQTMASECVHLVNVTESFANIFYPDETKSLEIAVYGYQPDVKYSITYKVTDYDGTAVDKGEAPVLASKGWARITANIPDGTTGWFRIHLSLIKAGERRILDEDSIDIAVVPHPYEGVSLDESFFGIAGVFNGKWSPPDLNEISIVAVERLGAKWVRCFGGWESTARSKDDGGGVNWSRLDRMFAATQRYDIGMVIALGFTPGGSVDPANERPLFRGTPLRDEAMPPFEADWISYVEAMAKRYRNKKVVWEIWNEPNTYMFWLGGDAETYAHHYMSAYQTIQKADPDVQIMMGGLSGVKPEWIEKFANTDGAAPALSILNVHPYRYPSVPPEAGDRSVSYGYGSSPLVDDLASLEDLAGRLPTLPDGKKREVWITEVGYNTMPGEKRPLHATISESEQAELLVRTIALARTTNLKRLFWWRLFDTYGAGMGLLQNQSRSFGPKPAYVAYAVLASKIDGSESCAFIPGMPEGVYAVKCVRNGLDTIIIWNISDDVMRVVAEDYDVYNMMGAEIKCDQNGEIGLSPSPVYLVGQHGASLSELLIFDGIAENE